MPAKTNGTTKRFELPALDFKFGSLTEGTDIPPPLPSPVAEELPKVPTPPQTPPADAKKLSNGASTTGTGTPEITTASGGVKRPAEPVSPTESSRPGSILTAATEQDSIRPESRTNGSLSDVGGKKSKRASGWFSRLRSHEAAPGSPGKRASVMVLPPHSNGSSPSVAPEKPMHVPVVRKPSGPPPPMIPELSELKSKVDVEEQGSLGGDLFKDITIRD